MNQDEYFCHKETPTDLKEAVREIPKMQRWVKPPRTTAELHAALDYIYVHHTPQRTIIEAEIAKRRHEELVSASHLSMEAFKKETPEDIVEVRPIFAGVGLNLNALYRKIFRKKK